MFDIKWVPDIIHPSYDFFHISKENFLRVAWWSEKQRNDHEFMINDVQKIVVREVV